MDLKLVKAFATLKRGDYLDKHCPFSTGHLMPDDLLT